VNTVRKGSRKELEVTKMLESMGYSCEKVRKTKMFSGDYFGCADIIAMNKRELLLVAVTDVSHVSRARRKLKAFTNHPPGTRKVIYSYAPPKTVLRNGKWRTEEVT